eukprot:CAMPEP_0113494022 /NCGR_PEP_ID=MMETSP0014_2-20120614/28894_1 /TAXON_ID=2857 /ORGANISM="Nitzschia sp." /LENGTH=387 /DNA_ID=CAMNT_0000387905 /DNA_START=212 /DNA_END=1375 /DNA_ORIENTATION=- /assembly_acc=CAM_ASM_000159
MWEPCPVKDLRYPSFTALGISAKDLLYQDQQEANARRAAVEETLLGKIIPNLEAPIISAARVASGSGFGGGRGDRSNTKKKNKSNKKTASSSSSSSSSPRAVEQAKIVARDGVLRIDNALSPDLADAVREHVLLQQKLADEVTAKDAHVSTEYYGVENRRKNRCDLLLSLAAPEQDTGEGGGTKQESEYVIPQALKELLGQDGTLRPIFEELVTLDGEFYEFAAVITDPGSDRQQVHPDLPFRPEAPLYVVFLALQDVTESMGPTTFLLGSQSYEERVKFDDLSQRDEQLATSNSRLALLRKGDAVLFDARLLHCGNANEEQNGATRAMFNFSFRNPKETGNLGYCGSMRPGYVGAMTLGGISDALLEYEKGNKDPFARYGNGLVNT